MNNKYYVGSLANLISNSPLVIPPYKKKMTLVSNAGAVIVTNKQSPGKGEKRKLDVEEEPNDNVVKNKRKRKAQEAVNIQVKAENQNEGRKVKNRKKRKNELVEHENETEAQNENEGAKKKNRKKKKNKSDDMGSESKDKTKKESLKKKKRVKAVLDPEKEARSIFIGNVPTTVKIHKLKSLFTTFGKVEVIRYRSIARANKNMSKRTAAITKSFHPERTSLVAYLRFESLSSVAPSLQMNNSVLEGHTLRVDRAENTRLHDQKKSVFVGNVPFAAEDDELRKVFADCGCIVGVRIIRDNKTGLGKGFAYVNFESTDGVELALAKDGYFIGNRQLRVHRSVKKEVKGMRKKGPSRRIGRRPLPPHLRQKNNQKANNKDKLSFQGETTGYPGKAKKKPFSKADFKKSIIADVLSGGRNFKPKNRKKQEPRKNRTPKY